MRESEKRVIERGETSVLANLRPSLMIKSFAVRTEAVSSSLQEMAMEWARIEIAALTDRGAERQNSLVYMWKELW